MFEHAHRRFSMRKGLFFLLAALLVVGLPLSAALAAGTTVYHFKEVPYYNYLCYDKYNPYNPGPAAEFGTELNPTVCVDYIGTSQETVRVKVNNDGTTDVGWNRQIKGTAVAYSSGGSEVAFARTMAEGITGLKVQKPAQAASILFEGNFQVEEVIQDDGGDAGCLREDNSADLESCMWTGNMWNLDYIMYHWKINGNSIYFWKTTMKNGEFCQEDTRAPEGSMCSPYE
jgi:hypothetical protein